MRVITNFKIEDDIRAFVIDNASSNDTVVNSLLERLAITKDRGS
jgi:hypothetical protein